MPKKSDPSVLFHPDTRRGFFLDYYYELLNEHPPFRDALETLFNQYQALRAARAEREQAGLLEDTGATQRRHVLLSAFVAAWHLPTDLGSRHLQWSLDLAAQGVPLRLCSDGSLYSSRPRGELVRPLQPEPFVYDPARTSPREARARAKQMAKAVETSILEQLRAVEERFEAGGWDRLPHKRDWPLVALRIFRRAVLEEPWEEIARADKVAVETVRETVERRAKEFRIPLPEFSPGPRPKI